MIENEVSERGERDCSSARTIGDRADKRALFVTDITEILRGRGRAGERKRQSVRERQRKRLAEREREAERGSLGAIEVSAQCLNKMPSLIECTRP